MAESDPVLESSADSRSDLETTAKLIARIRAGDPGAQERLISRYLPALRRWAHNRLPAQARHLAETDDIVQITLLRTLKKMKGFEARRSGAFFAYLRRALQNQIRDQIRAAHRRPAAENPPEPRDPAASPLELAIGNERLEAYEEALEKLTDLQREAIIMRVELGSTYAEIGEVIGSPSPNAARMLVSRGLVRLAELMHVD